MPHPDGCKSLPSPVRPSHLPLELERATPTQQTRLPTVPSPVRPPPRPVGTPTPVLPTGLPGSVGRREESAQGELQNCFLGILTWGHLCAQSTGTRF